MIRRGALALLFFFALAGVAAGSEQRPTLAELEREVICPDCHTTLALSDAPIADRMRAFIRARLGAGDTKSEVKDKLVAEFGEGVLAAPPARGFNLLAWVLPLAGLLLGGIVLAVMARRWSRAGKRAPGDAAQDGRGPLDPATERRLDEELARFDA
jgi:cytochrome c-type biogenesis protein CcmH